MPASSLLPLTSWKLRPLLLKENLCTVRSSSSCGLCSLSCPAAPLFPAAVSVAYFTIHNHNCGCDNFFFSWPLKKPFKRCWFHLPSNQKGIGFQHILFHRSKQKLAQKQRSVENRNSLCIAQVIPVCQARPSHIFC